VAACTRPDARRSIQAATHLVRGRRPVYGPERIRRSRAFSNRVRAATPSRMMRDAPERACFSCYEFPPAGQLGQEHGEARSVQMLILVLQHGAGHWLQAHMAQQPWRARRRQADPGFSRWYAGVDARLALSLTPGTDHHSQATSVCSRTWTRLLPRRASQTARVRRQRERHNASFCTACP
jgi:hypothetical protein